MKQILFFLALTLWTLPSIAQQDAPKPDMAKYKIVIQLTSADTNVQKMVVKQIGNVLAAAPNSQIEIVCHAAGISMLMTAQTHVQPKIIELKDKGVHFLACENTLRERKITKEEIIPQAEYVPVGLLEIVRKQEKGWSYIRAAL